MLISPKNPYFAYVVGYLWWHLKYLKTLNDDTMSSNGFLMVKVLATKKHQNIFYTPQNKVQQLLCRTNKHFFWCLVRILVVWKSTLCDQQARVKISMILLMISKVYPDQIASSGVVWSVCTLFAILVLRHHQAKRV